MHIPEGYGTVFPYMVVDRLEPFVIFLKTAFDAKELGRTVMPNGRVANCRIRIGTTSFMVSEAEVPNSQPMPAAYYIYVEDADATFAKAIANGAKSIFPPMNMPYQDRQGGVVDMCGNTWWISTHLEEEGYD